MIMPSFNSQLSIVYTLHYCSTGSTSRNTLSDPIKLLKTQSQSIKEKEKSCKDHEHTHTELDEVQEGEGGSLRLAS